MVEAQATHRTESRTWPFAFLLAALVLIVVLALGWLFFMTANITVPLFGGVAVIGFVVLAVSIYLAAWVHTDATEIGVPALPWTLVVLFLFVIGLAIYLLMREFRPSKWPGRQE